MLRAIEWIALGTGSTAAIVYGVRRHRPGRIGPWLLLAGAYLRRPYQRLWQLSAGQPAGVRLAALPWPPLIRLTGDAAKMLGYPAGVAWRLRQPRHKAVTAPIARDFG